MTKIEPLTPADAAERAKAARDALGMTQERLAAALGLKARQLRRYERGDVIPKPWFWLALAQLRYLSERIDKLQRQQLERIDRLIEPPKSLPPEGPAEPG